MEMEQMIARLRAKIKAEMRTNCEVMKANQAKMDDSLREIKEVLANMEDEVTNPERMEVKVEGQQQEV
jgi:hypothetical protein